MGEYITSRSNGRIKRIKSLEQKKNRLQEGVFVIEGIRIIDQAIEAGISLEGIYISSSQAGTDQGETQIEQYREKGIDVTEVADDIFREIQATVNGQGVVAIAPIPKWNPDELFNAGAPVLVLDRIQDPGNLGTMIRTADAAGFGAVICIKGTVDIYNDKVVRSTMGSMFSMPVIYVDEDSLALLLKDHGYELYAADLEAAQPYDQVEYGLRSALVIGNEGSGISERIRNMSHAKVIIPIFGQAESLNAAVAAGILMYHMVGAIRRI